MDHDETPPPGFAEAICGSFERHKAAGIIKEYTRDPSGQGVVVWTDDALVLLNAGPSPVDHLGLLEAWATGDPLGVRRRLEGEATTLRARQHVTGR